MQSGGAVGRRSTGLGVGSRTPAARFTWPVCQPVPKAVELERKDWKVAHIDACMCVAGTW